MTDEPTFDEQLPAIREIANPDLRASVRQTWAWAVAASDFASLGVVPWWPPHERRIGEQSLVDHVRAVTDCAIAVADALAPLIGPDNAIRRDDVVAGALLHDVSKVFEITDGQLNATHDLLPHPHLGVFVLRRNGHSEHLQHVVLAHSDRSAVEPRTIEAEIVSRADALAVDAAFWDATGQRKRHAPPE